jgi:3-oxoacyl-[acyl-carrier protein] reductase
MNLHLENQVVFVAGSSRGIGKAIAHAFLEEGCRTAISGREPESLALTLSEFEADFGPDMVMSFQGDLLERDVVDKTVKQIHDRWGKLDCLVANIGNGRGRAGWDLDELDWQRMFDANLWSSLRVVNAILPEMITLRNGSIVIIASIVGIESTLAPLPYSAAKSALVNYSKNLARLMGQYNVRVNCVAPGNILFPGGSWEKHLNVREQEVMQMIQDDVPLQRFGQPQEIADLIVFLSSQRSSFITGACIVADGGQTRSI